MDMEIDSQTDASNLHRLIDLPDELWADVFDRVSRPTDILNAMLTCKRFHRYARLSLYRVIHYRSPRRMERNSLFLASKPRNDPLLVATNTVIVSGELGRGLRPPSREHFRVTSLFLDLNSQRGPQNPGPYNTLHSLLQNTFAANLTKLVFIGANLPASFFKLLPTLPNLRRLYLHSSSPEAYINSYRNLSVWNSSGSSQASQAFNLPQLPHLVEFRAWRLEWFDPHRHPHVLSYLDTTDIIRVAPNLHTLWIDWSSIISGRLMSSDFEHLFISLRTLHLRFPPLPTHSHHEYEEEEHEDTRTSENLAGFLRKCENIEELVIAGIVSSDMYKHERRGLDLHRLKRYHGPLDFLLFVTGSQQTQLEAVTISTVALPRCRSEYGRWETEAQVFCSMLRRLDALMLKELNFSCHEWNNELIFCIVKCFPKLSALRIAFLHGELEEGEMLSLGAIHLASLPSLTTLHLYRHLLNQRRVTSQSHQSLIRYSGSSGDFSTVQRQADMMLQSIGACTSVDAGESCAETESSLADPEDIKEVLAGWKKHTVNLKEVKLTANGVWTRGKVIESDAEAKLTRSGKKVQDGEQRVWGAWRMRQVSLSEVDSMWFDAELEKRRELRAFM
ncbi:hypothetical protein WG66_015063 [Moniliophthora roreri]|nr:hypothetical protein WG66_015063 [Moniliophthora roreri]